MTVPVNDFSDVKGKIVFSKIRYAQPPFFFRSGQQVEFDLGVFMSPDESKLNQVERSKKTLGYFYLQISE